jgi:hypothetical protein
MTKLIAIVTLVGALVTLGCHNNKPANNPSTAPAPVQGPPP